MKDDRLRVTHQSHYSEALGLAAFCFARCEWDTSYCCERLQLGYLNTIEPERKTAGKIAKELCNLVASIDNNSLREHCEPIVSEFVRVVRLRNDLMHGKLWTALNGDQVLSDGQGIWSIERINAFADAATACQIKLNDLVHHRLT